MRVIAVIPAYKEETRIEGTIRGVLPYVERIVVVDDGSPDATGERAAAVGAMVFRHRTNRGQGAALRTGTEAAIRLGADAVIHIDADGQHDPTFIPTLTEPIVEGKADIVFGSRFLGIEPEGMPLLRRSMLIAARTFNALVMGIPRTITDPQSGMRALTRRAAQAIDFRQDQMAHASEILRLATRSGLPWMEVPVRVRYSPETLAKGQFGGGPIRIVWQLLLGIFTSK